jgi:proton-dependent oligopeptide transporter, POT family
MINISSHPRGLFYLFFAEMWERFSFYGMRALLILYMTKYLLFSKAISTDIYAAYMVLIYATPVIGGFLADRILGNQKAIMIGGILISIGHLTLSIDSLTCFYLGLGFIVSGTGLFKANISTLLGQLYKTGDPRRDSGFTIFYMGINIGAFLASLICGYVGEKYGWHIGFALASIGMLTGVITFYSSRDKLEGHGLCPNPQMLKESFLGIISKEQAIYLLCLMSVPFFAYAIANAHWFSYALPAIGVCVLVGIAISAQKFSLNERKCILTILILAVFQMVFFALFEQAGSSLTLFADQHTQRNFANFSIQSSQLQALNPLFIIMLTPLFSWLWTFLAKQNKDPFPPVKFVLGLLQVGAGFAVLIIGINLAQEQMSSLWFLTLAYLLHTTGELCLSPVGLSMVTKLAPKQILSTMMGVWFLSIAFAHHLAGFISKMAYSTNETLKLSSILQYKETFTFVAWVALFSAIILLLLRPFLNKMIARNT